MKSRILGRRSRILFSSLTKSRHRATEVSDKITFETLEQRSMMAGDANPFAPMALPATADFSSAWMFQAKTEDSNQSGARSSQIDSRKVDAGKVLVPAAPTDLVATAGDGRVTLSWVAPVGSEKKLSYTVQYWSVSTTQWISIDRRFEQTGAVIKNLTNGVVYQFQVAAVNRAGVGEYSLGTGPVIPNALVVTVPDAPSDLVAKAGSGRVQLSWKAPVNNGGSKVEYYTVQYWSVATTQWISIDQRFEGTKAEIKNLTNGVVYQFQVAAVNKAGVGEYSYGTGPVIPIAEAVPNRPSKNTSSSNRR